MSNATYINYYFPIPFLTKFEGEPTYQYIHEAHLKMKTNKGSNQSGIGGKGNGLIGLVMCLSLYLILNGSTTPKILASDPVWIHSIIHNQTCEIAQGAQDTIWYH